MSMVSALTRKSLKDLSRRRARTIFTVLTVAFGVAGLGMMAIEDLADRGMADQISESRMYNIRINVEDVALNATNVREMGELDNVRDVEPRAIARGKMYIGERRVQAVIIGIEDLADQRIDVTERLSGELPGPMEVLTEEANSVNGVYQGGTGDTFQLINFEGRNVTVRI